MKYRSMRTYRYFACSVAIVLASIASANTTVLQQNHSNEYLKAKEKYHISGFLLGELILSNYDQGKPGRFTDKRGYSTFCFPRANVNLEAKPEPWLYGKFALNFRDSCGYGGKNDEWTFRKFGIADEAFITIYDPEAQPFFAKVGVHYLPYGTYKRHSIPATFTQLLTQSQTAGTTFGIIKPNYNLAAFISSNKPRRNGSQKIGNAGAQVSLMFPQWFNLNFNLSYMHNIAATVNYIVNNNSNPLNTGYRKAVSGIATHLSAQYDNFVLTLQYTRTLNKFSPLDLQWQNTGAIPAAASANLDYNIKNVFSFDSKINFSYQHSWQAVNIRGISQGRGLPKKRYQGGYSVFIDPYIEIGSNIIIDHDYKTKVGGTNRTSLTFLLHMLARFF